MYTQTWDKYLPVIRILLKRAITQEQTLQLNTSDFQKAATVRKTGPKFTIGFSNGKSDNITGLPDIAKNLSSVLLYDPAAKKLLSQHAYTISFDTKCQLILRRVVTPALEEATPVEEAATADWGFSGTVRQRWFYNDTLPLPWLPSSSLMMVTGLLLFKRNAQRFAESIMTGENKKAGFYTGSCKSYFLKVEILNKLKQIKIKTNKSENLNWNK